MQTVDIYLTTSHNAPGKVGIGWYRYRLSCGGSELEGSGEERLTTGNRLALLCAIEALKRMRRPSVITIHTSSQYIYGNAGRILEWKANGWRSRGKEIKNADLWEQLYGLQKGHAVRYQPWDQPGLEHKQTDAVSGLAGTFLEK